MGERGRSRRWWERKESVAVGEEGVGGGGEAGGGRGRSRRQWAASSMERRSGSSGEEKWGKEGAGPLISEFCVCYVTGLIY